MAKPHLFYVNKYPTTSSRKYKRRKEEGRACDIFTSGKAELVTSSLQIPGDDFIVPLSLNMMSDLIDESSLRINKVIILVCQVGLPLDMYSRPEYNNLASLCRAGNQAQDFMHASQVLHQLNYISSSKKVAIIDSYLSHPYKPECQLLCNWPNQSFLKFTHPIDLIKIRVWSTATVNQD